MSSIYKKVAKDLFLKYIPQLSNKSGGKAMKRRSSSGDYNNNSNGALRISCSFIEIAGDFCFDLFNSSASTQLLTGCDGTVYASPVVEPEVCDSADI